MANGIYAALSGAISRALTIDVVANDLANVETAGYKGTKVSFKEQLTEVEGTVNETHRQVHVDSVEADFRPGSVKMTGNPLDVAILGDGFFEVGTAEGVRYTRSGSFVVNSEGQLAMSDGPTLMGDGGPIQVPPDKSIKISQIGQILAGELELGKLKIVEFENRDNLKRSGHNLWVAENNAAQTPVEIARVQPGAIERSNVNMIRGMTDLVRVSRSYESLLKAIQTFRMTDSKTTAELGK